MAQSENLDFQENFQKNFIFLGRNIENIGLKNSKKNSIFFNVLHIYLKISLFLNFFEKLGLLKISNEGHCWSETII